MIASKRLSELDWLRVFLILGVFLHHTLMPFNGDDWHIMNNESSKLLDDIMVYFEQIRLPILFFIAGVGSVILLDRVKSSQFLKDKINRLFLPLMVGIIIIVPPQGYIENIELFESYWKAYPILLGKFESNHLWFIEYLLIFSLLAIPIRALLNTNLAKPLINIFEEYSDRPNGLFYLVLALILLRVSLKISFPYDSHGIENLSSSAFYFFFFLIGMIFIQSNKIWVSLAINCRRNLYWLIASSLLFYSYYLAPDLSEILSLQSRRSLWFGLCCLVSWSALLTLVGYAQKYLSNTPSWLKMSNELIYPFYIFHQTIIVLMGFYIIALNISLLAKALILIIGAFIVTSGLCLFLVYPFNLTRKIFGLKKKLGGIST